MIPAFYKNIREDYASVEMIHQAAVTRAVEALSH
jgi:hypothetical protein